MQRTVLITGAAHGLGKALAEEFALQDWLVFASDLETSSFEHPSIQPLIMDVTDEHSIQYAFKVISQKTGSLDLLINNAGMFAAYPLSEIPFDELYRIYSLNTFGPFRVIRQFIPLLLPAKGRIVSISTESVKFPSLFQPYQATKIAMEAIHRTVSQELYLKGIRMALIRPGAVRSRMTAQVEHLSNSVKDSMFEMEFSRFATLAPGFRGRILSPETVARRIYRKVTRCRLKPVYRINNNPLLTLISWIPSCWMNRMLKWQLARR